MQAARQTVVDHLTRFLDEQRLAELPDAGLLERFATHRDDASFAVLVRRHGPSVLGSCRRLLGQTDAEDAFQAAFLVLARRAGSLRKRESLGAWLHGVAYRISSKARVAATRRRRHEERAGLTRGHRTDAGTQPESFALLDEELSRMPACFREPLVLCYLDGLTREEAARRLSLSPRTLKDRLERGRAMLRESLERRGIAGNTLAGLLAPTVPGVLAGSAVRHAVQFATNQGEIPRTVLALAESVLTTTLASHVGTGMLVLLALGGLILGVGIASGPPRVEVRKVAPPVPPLEEVGPKVDRHGDPLPEGAMARLGTVRLRQGSAIVHIALSRDGKLLATAEAFDRVRLWDTHTGKLIRESIVESIIFAIAFSPDADRLACSTTHKGVYVFEVKTGKDVTRLPEEAIPENKGKGDDPNPRGRNPKNGPVGVPIAQGRKDSPTAYTSLVFSPNGHLLAGMAYGVVPQRPIHVWRVSDGERLHAFPHDAPTGLLNVLSFSADGKRLAAGGKEPSVWDLTTGKVLAKFPEHKSQTQCAVLSPDGTILAVGYDDSLTFWDTKTKKPTRISSERRGRNPTSLAFTGDGKTLFSSSQHETVVRQWDVKSGQEIRTLPSQSGDGLYVAVSADGKTLAVAGDNGTARIWHKKGDSAWEALAFSEAHESQVHHLAFSPDGRTLASTSWHGPARLWDVPTRKQLASQIGHADGVYNLAFAPDGKALVLSFNDSKVRWCNPRTGAVERSLSYHPMSFPMAIGFLDGKTLVAGYSQRNVHLVEMGKEAKLRPLKGDNHFVSQIRFSPDGRTLATSSSTDKTIILRDAATGRQTRKIDDVSAAWALALSADGKFLAAGAGNGELIRIWDLRTAKECPTIRDHPHRIDSLAFSRDGRWLASSCGDNAIRLYETASWKQSGLFRGHLSQARGLAFSPDGRILASGSDDTSILLWDVSDRFAKRRPAKLTRPQLDALWVDLAGDAEKARHALWTLARSPQESIPFLHDRLIPMKIDSKRIAQRIAELDDDAFGVRERATADLQSLGEAAGPAMHKALETNPSAEVKLRLQRALRLLDQVKGEPKRLRELRVRAALEYAATLEARRLLDALPKE